MWSQKEGVSGIKHYNWDPLYGTIMFLYIKFPQPPQMLVMERISTVENKIAVI